MIALAVVVVAVLAVVVADRVALQHTESGIAARIEERMPGSHATVSISSSPFLLHLAISGTVQEMHAHVTGVDDGRLRFDSVDVTVHNVKVSRTSLMHGSVRLLGLSDATVTARVSVAEVLRATGYGRLAGLGGLASGLTASLRAESGRVQLTFGPVTFTLTYNSLVPCVGSAHVSGGEITLTCTTTTLPPALRTA